MVLNKILLGAVVCFVAMAAAAQDPMKVEPTHYRLSFQNEHVEVISVHYGPHEKSGLHDHPGGVVVALTKAHLRFTDQTGRSQELYSEPGEARWFPPVKHRVENLGDTPYNAVYIAIKRPNVQAGNTKPAPLDPDTQKMVAEIVASLRQ